MSISSFSDLPEEFWNGKSVRLSEGSVDIRAKFSRDIIVVRIYSYLGPNQFVPDNENYKTFVYTGNFNYRNGAFVNGVLTGFYTSGREKGYGKDKVYPDGSVASYQVSGRNVDRQSLASLESDPSIKEVSFSQGDGGFRFVRLGQIYNYEPYIRYNTLQELHAGMRAEGIPEVLIDPYFGYLTDPLLKFDFPTISSSVGGGTVSDQIVVQAATTSIDTLLGSKNQKDQFQFILDPINESAPDRIVNFNTKEGDNIQISKAAFGIATGRFAVAKKPKSLNKLLSTDVDIVYNRKLGQLILNANGAERGVGVDGGVFALLSGSPLLNNSLVSFV